MKYAPNGPIICHPIFLDDARSRIGAIIRSPVDSRDVRWMEDAREGGSRFVYDVFAQWSESEIEANTRREIRISRTNKDATAKEDDARRRNSERDRLFDAKRQAVAEVGDKRLRRLARKSDSLDRVLAVRAADILLSIRNEDEQTEPKNE